MNLETNLYTTIGQAPREIATIEPLAYAYGGLIVAGALALTIAGVAAYERIMKPIGRFFRDMDERVFGPKDDTDRE